MRSRWAVGLALVLSIWSQLPLDACGDKFLMVGRGAKFDRVFASLYPGTIVILARDLARATERTSALRKALTYAGHRVSLIRSDEVTAALQRSRTDIVIADGHDAPTIDPQLTLLASKPTMLYVLMDKEPKQATGVNTLCELKQSDRLMRWLQVIDDAMQARARSGMRFGG